MSITSDPNEEIRRLFQKHVPEVATGIVELAAVARESGRLAVAVRSHDSNVDPVGACVGMRGIHPKNISRELGGDKVSIVLWSESPEVFVLHAVIGYGFSGVKMPKVTLDATAHQARVEVDRATLAFFEREGGTRLRLASELVGWEIHLICDEQN